jgi:hypothetical protein
MIGVAPGGEMPIHDELAKYRSSNIQDLSKPRAYRGRQMVILGKSSVPITGAYPRAVSCETTAWERSAKVFLISVVKGGWATSTLPCYASSRGFDFGMLEMTAGSLNLL